MHTKAADHEDFEIFEVGLCYKIGWGVEKDPVKAVEWFRKAADKGHKVAQINLEKVNLLVSDCKHSYYG